MATVAVPPGVICTPEEYARAATDPLIHCLTRGQSIGLTVVVESGLLSLIAVSYVFLIILRNLIWRFVHVSSEKFRVFHQPMDYLMFSLFFADILQAIGAVMDIKWIQKGKVEAGGFCDAQGIIQHVGETGVAVTTLVIAIYTFLGVWVGKNIQSVPITRAVLGTIWFLLALVVVIGNTVNKEPRFEAPTPYWCWISGHYLKWRMFAEYVLFWITLAFSIFVYIPLYFWVRGNIVIHDPEWWRFHFQHADKSDPELRRRRRRSFVMAAYPLVYCLSILPMSVARWIGFVQEGRGDRKSHVPPAATFLAAAIFNLSGFCNIILLLTTKPDAELFGHPTKDSGRMPSPFLPSCACGASATIGWSESLDAHSGSLELKRVPKDEEEGSEGHLPSLLHHTPVIAHAPPAAPTMMLAPQQAAQPTLTVGFVITPADVEIGPLVWGSDITGQVRALINHLPNAHLLSQNIRARRGRTNFVFARFPSNVAAIQFVNAWRRDTPTEFSHLSVNHSGN